MLESRLVKGSKDSPVQKKGRHTYKKECRTGQQREAVARKRYYLHSGMTAADPYLGGQPPLHSQARIVSSTVPADSSMFLGCKLIQYGRDFQILAIDSSYGIKITFSFLFSYFSPKDLLL